MLKLTYDRLSDTRRRSLWAAFLQSKGREPQMATRLMILIVGVLVAVVSVNLSAQDRGFLAIGAESARYAFSFRGEADAINMCGTTDCEVVAAFDACIGVAYSRPTLERGGNLRIVGQGPSVWSWAEAAEEGAARVAAFENCQSAGGTACEVYTDCVDVPAGTSDLRTTTTQPPPISEISERLRTRLRRLAATLNPEITGSVQPRVVEDEAITEQVPRSERAAEAERDRAEAQRAAEAERDRAEAQRAAEAERDRAEAQRAAEAERDRAEAQRAAEAERDRAEAQRAAEAERDRDRAVPSHHCTKQRLMRLGVLTSSIDSGMTLEFTNSRMVLLRSSGGASVRQELEYSVAADSITYRIVRAVGTAPGFGTRDVPISNPGPHTVPCRLSGGVLEGFGDGTWR